MENNQSDIKNPEYISESYSNDASSSSFGWNFQYNAGVFLFLKLSDDVLSIEMENEKQDIVLRLRGNRNVYAQAKSAQDYTDMTTGDKNIKIKDAIISLAKTASKDINGEFIFISNIKEPIKDEDGISKLRITPYSSLNKTSQQHIDNLFSAIKTKMNKNIENIIGDKKISEKSKNTKVNSIRHDISSLELLEANKDKFFISTIVPFKGGPERFDAIKDELNAFLDKLNMSVSKKSSVCSRYLSYLQLIFEVGAGIKTFECKKQMKTSDLIWPISAILIFDNNSFTDVEDYLSFSSDPSNDDTMSQYINDDQFIYHTRFEFSNKVVQSFINFKKEFKNKDNVIADFLNLTWADFKSEFDDGIINSENLEYLTKYYLYRLICIREDIDNMYRWLGEDRI